jgi:hypothetical protein
MQELRATLEPGERLLWSGFPVQGIRFSILDVFLIPFSLVWGGGAILWESMAILGHAPWEFALFGIPFVMLGIYIIAGRFVSDTTARARTIYAVTDQRVLILSGVFNRNRRSLELVGLGEINSSERSNGSGTITFGPTNPFSAMRGWPAWGWTTASAAFEGVARVRDVLKAICDAQRSASRGPDS